MPKFEARLSFSSDAQDLATPPSVNLTTVAAEAMPRIVLAQLLHRWVHRKTGVALNTDRMQELTEFVLRPLAHGRTQKAFTISPQWELAHVRSGLYLLGQGHRDSWVPPSKTRARKAGKEGKPRQRPKLTAQSIHNL